MLGPILLNGFIIDLHKRTEYTLGKFVDDAKYREQVIGQRIGLLFRGTSTGWRNGLTGNLRSLTKTNESIISFPQAVLVGD